jgi:antirestriction protein ArdC
METVLQQPATAFTRRDIHQQVTDTIIQQLEKGIVPWRQPWKGGNDRLFGLPKNFTTGNKYRGVNILLLWTSAYAKQLTTDEWASFKQWQAKEESVRKGEKGTMIVYYDTFEKEISGELQKIPFLKSSVVFNRCQLASYKPEDLDDLPKQDLVTRIEKADRFIANTQAIVEHHVGGAYYSQNDDKICMPYREFFLNTEDCTATEGYYSVLSHELTHWTGSKNRLDRINHKKYGDKNYANEELVAELGGSFLCTEFGISIVEKGSPASYIDHWLKVLKEDKHCLLTAASGASKAVDFLHGLQPQ